MEYNHFCYFPIFQDPIDGFYQSKTLIDGITINSCYIVKFYCYELAVVPLTDNCLVLDMNISLYENDIMLNHTSGFYK